MISNLELKLSGTIPVTREELFNLVSSWGRKESFNTRDRINVERSEPNECYDLSNLDVSQIINLSDIFSGSLYDGDLSNWDTSNVTNMEETFAFSLFNNDSLKNWNVSNVEDMNKTFHFSKFNNSLVNWDVSSCKTMDMMFEGSKFNNDSISNWNTSNVTNMEDMFYNSPFNKDISNWDISNVESIARMFACSNFDGDLSKWKFNKNVDCSNICYDNENFINKYNDGNQITLKDKEFLIWFEKNREKIKEINIPKEEVLDFFSFDNNINIELKD